MHADGFFAQALVYLAAAVIAVPFASRLGLGSVLGYLLAGVAIGPYGLGFIGEEGGDLMHAAEFGVVMMLFLIGLELKPARLWQMRGPIFGLGGLQVALTGLAGGAVGVALGQDWKPALAIGLILALSSTAFVLQSLSERGLTKTEAGRSSFSVLLFQDIAVIPLLALLPLLADSAGGAAGQGASSFLPSWERALLILGAVGLVIGVGRWLARPVFRAIAATGLRELFTGAALLLILAVAALMTAVGLSPALGAFVAGVVLAGNEYRHALESDIAPFKGLLLGLFFIAVGSTVDFALLARSPGTIAGLLALLLAGKGLILLGLGRLFRLRRDQNWLFAFALAQGGEFGFVLFAFAAQQGVLPLSATATLTLVVALSMALSPLLLLVAEKALLPRLAPGPRPERASDSIDEEEPVIVAGFGDFGSAVGRLLRAQGCRPTVIDRDSDHVEALRRLGLPAYYGDATNERLLEAAGAAEAKLLVIGFGDVEAAKRIVETARRRWPELEIFAKARGRIEAYELLEAGVEHVYREGLDSSLRLGVDALRVLGFRGNRALRAARTFRESDERTLRELAVLRRDRPAYLLQARERIRQLEELMAADLEHETERDAGWDVEGLRREFGGAGTGDDGPTEA